MFNRLLEEAGMDWDVIALFFSEHPKPWTTLKMHENHQQKIRFFVDYQRSIMSWLISKSKYVVI